mmetsp:Transcript_11903/g.16669  ORF Transcript_11903/g.16669 Transcript_11903/m.16669 type:complete len:116 (-) Transcript_11903:17-364(-)
MCKIVFSCQANFSIWMCGLCKRVVCLLQFFSGGIWLAPQNIIQSFLAFGTHEWLKCSCDNSFLERLSNPMKFSVNWPNEGVSDDDKGEQQQQVLDHRDGYVSNVNALAAAATNGV